MHVLDWRMVSLDKGPGILTSLTEAETAKLQELAKGREVAEFGTGYGYSAIAMALGGASRVVSADPHTDLAQDSKAISRKNAEDYGVLDRIELRTGRAEDVFADESFDGVFVDGDHRYASVLDDCHLAESLVKPGGWIALHDYGEASCPGVKQAIDEWWSCPPSELIDTLYIRCPA